MDFYTDSVSIDKISENEKGYLVLKGTIAKVGNLTYFNSDGSQRIEYVPPETLFDKKHLNSIANSDFVEGHPAFINSDNYQKHTIGSVGSNVIANTIKDDNNNIIDGYIQVYYTVKHKDSVEKIKKGEIRGLSMGYTVQTDRKDGGIYWQKNRICNHHGLVKYPRCEGAGLHLDSASYWRSPDLEFNYDELIKPLLTPVKLYFFLDRGV